MAANDTILIPATEMHQVFEQALLKLNFDTDKAQTLAAIFTANSMDGIYTHGVNRFPRFVQYIQKNM